MLANFGKPFGLNVFERVAAFYLCSPDIIRSASAFHGPDPANEDVARSLTLKHSIIT